eukprot:scaffold10269_cov163-Skeletonema_marinoi.AAC.1
MMKKDPTTPAIGVENDAALVIVGNEAFAVSGDGKVTYDVVRRRYDQQMLEPCQRCFYTIMANSYGTLEAVDCRIHSVRYNMVLECLVVSPELTSSGHLRRCSDADTSNKCLSRAKDASILSRPTNMSH